MSIICSNTIRIFVGSHIFFIIFPLLTATPTPTFNFQIPRSSGRGAGERLGAATGEAEEVAAAAAAAWREARDGATGLGGGRPGARGSGGGGAATWHWRNKGGWTDFGLFDIDTQHIQTGSNVNQKVGIEDMETEMRVQGGHGHPGC